MAKIWYLGHSCFQLEIDGVKIVVDPFITGNPLVKDITLTDIEADLILVTHSHGDHILDLMELAKNTNAQIISNFEITTWVENQGYSNVRPMNIGGNYSTKGIDFKVVVANHSSSFPDGTYGGNPVGFIISGKSDCLYYAGDTGLTLDMKLIKDDFDLTGAFLPIGDNFTMGYEDAAKAATFCGAKTVIGMHYDTFGYIEIDHNAAKEAFEKRKVTLLLPSINEKLDL